MKKAILIPIALLLTSCGSANKIEAHWQGYAEVCVKGIVYLQFPSGATVEIDKSTDKAARCD